MAVLTYTMITSSDGFVTGPDGRFEWALPSVEVHRHANAALRASALEIYGRRMYELMSYWQGVDENSESEPGPWRDVTLEFAAAWRDTDKVVISRTLTEVSTPRTRLLATLDGETVRELKEASGGDLAISGPTLAGHALAQGLVDEVGMYVVPVAVGGGLRFLPDAVAARARLLEDRSFENGWLYLRYAIEP